MQPFTVHRGIAAPLKVSDVDTDQIIPARYCAAVTKDGLEDALFADWRGSDQQFILNDDRYRDATVLVAGDNFGSGSSREWAVWALQEYGFRAILAPQYGDIFQGNAHKNGLLTVEMPAPIINRIWNAIEGDPGLTVEVDLEQKVVKVAADTYTFALDDHTRWRLLNGYDDIGLTFQHLHDIEGYEERRRSTLPATKGKTM